MPASPQRARWELDLLLGLSDAEVARFGSASPRLPPLYGRARELSRSVEGRAAACRVLGLHAIHHWRRAEYSQGVALLAEHLPSVLDPADPFTLATASRCLGQLCLPTGWLGVARSAFERAYAHLNAGALPIAGNLHLAATYWLRHLAVTLMLLGYPDQALAVMRRHVSLAERTGWSVLTGGAHQSAAKIAYRLGGGEEALGRWAEAMGEHERAAAGAMRDDELWSAVERGALMVELGDLDAGIDKIRASIAAMEAAHWRVWRTEYLSYLADAYGRAGQPDQGLVTVGQALDVARYSGEHFLEPALHHLGGELLLQRGGEGAAPRAAACFRRAMRLARRQEAKLHELEAATSLARLLGERGRRDEALAELHSVYEWFTEGFDTKPLREARRCCGELA